MIRHFLKRNHRRCNIIEILVITGSPHKKGTSALLTDEFIRGAKEAGHEVNRFDAAFEDVHPCIGCGKCIYGKNPCVFNHPQ